ncbi:MAG: YceI family protein [Gammaproteobacteria bacterium]
MALLLIFIGPLQAAPPLPSWQIVSKDSILAFTATQNDAPVSGTFKKFAGDIHFDPLNLKDSKVRMVVDIASLTTAYGEVADILKTADWFEAKLFPQAIFIAQHFIQTGDKTYQAKGDLFIKGKNLPVTLTFTLEEYTLKKTRVKGSTTLKRTLFGIGKGDWSKTDEIRDDVQVNFNLTAVSHS